MKSKIEKINSEFIQAIKSRINGPAIEILSEILPLSKEALYRRLRGEVLFTYSEAALIAGYFRISLDEINSIDLGDNILGTYDPQFKASQESYIKIINFWMDNISHYYDNENSHFYVMTSGIPVSLLTSYKSLLKLNYYVSLYETGGLDDTHDKFSEIVFPQSISDILAQITQLLQGVNTTYIISDNIFTYYQKQISYLKELELIDEEDITQIRSDLYSLINDFKIIATSGKFSTGKSADFYLSEVNIDSSFGIFEEEHSSLAFIKMFGINYRISVNGNMIKVHKHAFDNMKHFATVISKSGSARRISFFKEQLSVIDKIV